jgi:hypothetical protein
MTTATVGHQSKVSINGTAMEYKGETLKKVGTIAERDGIRGTRSPNVLDTRTNIYTVSGGITIEPSAADLNALMVLALGANGAVGETLTSFSVVVDRDYNVVTYENCKVNSATLRGSQGGVVELALDLVGKTANTTGSVSAPTVAIPFIMADLTLTLGNTAYETMEFELVVNNNLATDRFMNSLTLTDIPVGERLTTLRTVHAYNANSNALWEPALAGPSSPNTLVLNNGTNTVTFTFGALQAPREDPDVDKGEIMLTKNWIARKTGNTNEIAVALS